jgi:hypothetical protein
MVRKIPGTTGVARVERSLDTVELNISKVFARNVSAFLKELSTQSESKLSGYYSRIFADYVVLEYLKETHQLRFDISELVDFLKELSEESYENKSLSFGVIIDKKKNSSTTYGSKIFPRDFTKEKKYKALSDGYRTAFLLDKDGRLNKLMDLDKESNSSLRGEHYFPEWSRNMALTCVEDKIGFALTRQGDILFFQNGSLKFSRRFGQWQYWNHAYIIDLLKNKARTQHVQTVILGKVVSKLYRYSLDISFRRSGGLFVLMSNQRNIKKIIREGDGLHDRKRADVHKQFEEFLLQSSILGINRNVMIDLSAIDGAIVLSNHGWLLAYGAVLLTKKSKQVNKEQGSRSKAAVSASDYGISIKISSDGAISFYEAGNKFLEL